MIESVFAGGLLAAFAAVVILTVVAHLVLFYLRPLRERGTKLLEYWCLGFASLGLVAVAGDARRTVASMDAESARARAISALQVLRYCANGTYHCQDFILTDYNTERFSSAQELENDACNWTKQVAEVLPLDEDIDSLLERPIVLPRMPQRLEQDPDEVRDVLSAKASLDSRLAEYQQNRRAAAHSALEHTLRLFGPLLFALALALGITKVSLDLRMMRTRERHL